MKRILFLVIAVVSSVNAFSQTEDVKERVNKAKDRFVFELNINQMIRDKSTGFDLKGFSGGFATYFMYDVVIKDSPVSIAPGFGVASDHFSHNSQVVFTDSSTNFVPFVDSIGFKKSKLGLTYLDIPFELRFRGKPNKNNMQWSWASDSSLDLWWEANGSIRVRNTGTSEMILTALSNLRNTVSRTWNASAMELQHEVVTDHSTYIFTIRSPKIFKDGKSVDMQPITFGISINGL